MSIIITKKNKTTTAIIINIICRMVVLEKGAPHSMCLTESAKVGDTHTHTCIYCTRKVIN